MPPFLKHFKIRSCLRVVWLFCAVAASGEPKLSCQPGFAEANNSCVTCDVGHYSLGGNTTCQQCTNAPAHSFYIDCGPPVSPDCCYECDANTATAHCYSSSQFLTYNSIGVPGIAGICLFFVVPRLLMKCAERFKLFNFYIEDGLLETQATTEATKQAAGNSVGRLEIGNILHEGAGPKSNTELQTTTETTETTDCQQTAAGTSSVTVHVALTFLWNLRATLGISFLKMVFSIVFSLSTNLDYLHCGHTEGLTCTASDVNDICAKHGISDDQYVRLTDDAATCTVNVSGHAVCANWLMFTFSVLLANTVHYLYQRYCFIQPTPFDPQWDIYNAINNDDWRAVLRFSFNREMSFLALLELWVVVMSWIAVNVYAFCGAANDRFQQTLLALVFAILMTSVEFWKVNAMLVWKQWRKLKCITIVLLLMRLDLAVLNALAVALHSFVFLLSVVWYAGSVAVNYGAHMTEWPASSKNNNAEVELTGAGEI